MNDQEKANRAAQAAERAAQDAQATARRARAAAPDGDSFEARLARDGACEARFCADEAQEAARRGDLRLAVAFAADAQSWKRFARDEAGEVGQEPRRPTDAEHDALQEAADEAAEEEKALDLEDRANNHQA